MAATVTEGIYAVTVVNDSTWVNLWGAGMQPGAKAKSFKGPQQANDFWLVRSVGNNQYAIMSCCNGTWLTVTGASGGVFCKAPVNIQAMDKSQLFTFQLAGDSGTYQVLSVQYSGSCLDQALNGGSGGWTTGDIITFNNHNGSNQKFVFKLIQSLY